MDKSLKKAIIIASAIAVVYLLIFFGFYVWNLESLKLSSSPNDWSNFATYFSGIISPLIALLTAGILGYLSYQISERGAKENKDLFILEQKILAYQQLVSKYNSVLIAMKISGDFNEFSKVLSINMDVKNSRDEIRSNQLSTREPINNFYFSLRNFEIIYGHLFDYKFDSTDYAELMELNVIFCDWLKSPVKSRLNQAEGEDNFKIDEEKAHEFPYKFLSFTGQLKKELK